MPFHKAIFLTGSVTSSIAALHAQSPGKAVDLLLAEGHYLRAEQPIRAALEKNPNDAHALSNMSVVDWSFGRLDASLADAEKSVANAPSSVESHSHLTDALGSKLLTSSASTMQKISLAHRFRKEIDRTLELDSRDLDALQDLALFYWHAPGLVGGDKTKARETADKLFGISPFRGASARADFESDTSNVTRRNAAIQAIWRTAAAVAAKDYDVHAALATSLLEESGDPNHLGVAESEGKRALRLDSTRIGAYNVLAIVYTRNGRWNDLEALLKEARNAVPDNRGPGFRAAVALLTGNMEPQWQRAEQLLREYLAQPAEGEEPNHAQAHWRLGQVLERQGRRADAIKEYQTAVKQDGSLNAARQELKRLGAPSAA